jgi:hypothetical protein
MRKTGWAILLALSTVAGCAATPKQAARPMPKESDDRAVASAPAATSKPKELGGASVKIVSHKPSAQKYKFVGRIEARSASGDIVDAAIAADADLRRQAKALGADVIKLDVIAPPSDHPGKHSRVILAGRAYKKSS